MSMIAEVSWDYHRGAREPVFQVLKSWSISVNILISKKRKLGPKTVDCVFLGYAHQSIAIGF